MSKNELALDKVCRGEVVCRGCGADKQRGEVLCSGCWGMGFGCFKFSGLGLSEWLREHKNV